MTAVLNVQTELTGPSRLCVCVCVCVRARVCERERELESQCESASYSKPVKLSANKYNMNDPLHNDVH